MSDYFESGFTVREPSWHGKETVHDRYPNDWNEAREWAGMMWEPIEAPAFKFVGKREDGTETFDPADAVDGMYLPEEGRKRIVRSDSGATLGVRTDRYEIINHAEMGEIVEAILEQDNVKYETAGVIHEGKGVWALAFLDEPITLPGDNSITLPYFALTNWHDGSGSCKVNSTTVKIVCANTFAASEVEGDRNGTIFTFQHSEKWRDRISDARETIKGVRRDFNLYCETATELLGVKVTAEQTEQFIREFIPAPPEGLVTDRVMGNVEQARAAIRTILASPTSEGIDNTAWGLVQAAGEYLDHYRKARSLDSTYRRQLLRPEPLKTRAINLVREVVAN